MDTGLWPATLQTPGYTPERRGRLRCCTDDIMLGAVYFFGKLFGVLPVSFHLHCSSMGRHQHDTTEGPFKSSKVGTALTCVQLVLLLWTTYATLFGPHSSPWDSLDLLTATVCVIRASVTQGDTLRCLNRLYAVSQRDAPHFLLAACTFLPFCACQTFVSMFATNRAFPLNLDSLFTLFIPFSVENIVGIMEFALERQFRRINKELETLALQKMERATRKSNISTKGFRGLTNQKQVFSWSLRAMLRFLSRKLYVKWIRRLQNTFRRQEMFTRSSNRKIFPVTLRGSIRSVAVGGPLPWEAQAVRSRLHQTNTSAWLQSYGTNTNDSRVSELLQEMRISHGQLCDTASHINSRYGLEVLVATAANFCKLVLFLYKFIREIILQGDASNLLIAAMTINCILQLARILCVCYRCEQVRCETETSKDLLLKLSDTSTEPDAKQEAKVFILQLACKQIQFSACGFFCLNLALIRPVMGAITTYVALLMQFQSYGLSFK